MWKLNVMETFEFAYAYWMSIVTKQKLNNIFTGIWIN